MKFVFFGYDYSLDVAQRLIADGHELMAILSFPCDQTFAFNTQCHALANNLGIPITEKPVTESNITTLLDNGCQVFLSNGYPHKIPHIEESRAWGINIHPALLPRARGITPVPYIIMQEPSAAGFTVHKLTADFDAGDILYQEATPVSDQTDVDELAVRVSLRTPVIMSQIFANLPAYWDNATPQNPAYASFYPPVSEQMRTLYWTETARALALKGRAFGRYGVVGTIANNLGEQQKLAIFQFSVWEEPHNFTPGALLRTSKREVVVAIADGYAFLKDFQVIGN